MRAGDELFVAGDEVRGGRARTAAHGCDVVDPFEDDHVRHAGLDEHVAVEPCQGADTQAVAEHAVAADADIQDAHVDVRSLKASGEVIGPAAVGVYRCAVAIRDRIADGHDHPGVSRRGHLDPREEEPCLRHRHHG